MVRYPVTVQMSNYLVRGFILKICSLEVRGHALWLVDAPLSLF